MDRTLLGRSRLAWTLLATGLGAGILAVVLVVPGSAGPVAAGRVPGAARPATVGGRGEAAAPHARLVLTAAAPEALVAAARKPGGATAEGLEASLASLVRALDAGDRTAAEAARLSVGRTRDAGAILAAFSKAEDPRALEALARLLADSGALADASVIVALERLASDASPSRRAAALLAVGEAPSPDARRVDLLARAARGDAEPEVRQAGAQALGRTADRDATLAGAVNARLGEIAATDLEPGVRYEAAVALHVKAADPATLETLARLMRDDQDPAVKQAAAQALGEVAPAGRVRALDALGGQLVREDDPVLRRTLLTSIVRAGGEQAAARLDEIARSAPDLADDARDYMAALASGETDMDRLWRVKRAREVARLGPAGGFQADD